MHVDITFWCTLSAILYCSFVVTQTAIFWRCWCKVCTSTVKTNKVNVFDDNANVVLVNGPSQHDHTSDGEDEMIQSDAFREAVKTQVRDDPSRPVKRAYDATASTAVKGGYLRPTRHSVCEFSRIKSSAGRAKQEEVPRILRGLNDVDVRGVWAQTWNSDDFLLHWDNAWGMLMFATEENVQVLHDCHDLYVDGTFRTVPKPFYQYVSIHGKFKGRVVPLIHCLVSGKTVGHYRQILQNLKLNVRNLVGRHFRPKRIVCDFEQALISTVETELPRTNICACTFHFRQSLYRYLHQLGLSTAYKTDATLKSFVSKLMSIGFLPVHIVRQNFGLMCASREFRRLIVQYPDLNRFMAYVDNTYVRGRFPPNIWNVYQRSRGTRTNNYVEGFHNAWNQRVQVAHPSLWVFIRHLKDVQTTTETAIDCARRGAPTQRPVRKWRVLNRKIKRLTRRYAIGTISLDRYWRHISYLVSTVRQ